MPRSPDRCQFCPATKTPGKSTCPVCAAMLALASAARAADRHALARAKNLPGVVAGTAADVRTGDVDRPDPPERVVLYGLLTAPDVRELNRRRARLGLAPHRIARSGPSPAAALVAWHRQAGRHHQSHRGAE